MRTNQSLYDLITDVCLGINANLTNYVNDASLSSEFTWTSGLLHVDVSVVAGGVSLAYVDGSLAIRDVSIRGLALKDGYLDTSLNNIWTKLGYVDSSITKIYVDGSLAIRDVSIGGLIIKDGYIDSSLNNIWAKLEYIDTSLNIDSSIFFSRYSGYLTPKYSGDNIRLSNSSELQFGSAVHILGNSSTNNLAFYVAIGDQAMSMNTSSIIAYHDLRPETSNQNLGSTVAFWGNVYSNRLYIDNVNTYLDVTTDGSDMIFVDGSAGTKTLSDLISLSGTISKDYVDGSLATRDASIAFIRTGTNLKPTHPGDDILLAIGERITFDDGDSRIYSVGSDTLNIDLGGSLHQQWQPGYTIMYSSVSPNVTATKNLGTSAFWWNNLYVNKIYIKDAETLISFKIY